MQGFKDKKEIHNFEKLSSKVNARQSSKGSVENENLMQSMPMTVAKQSNGTKDNVKLVSHINKRIGRCLNCLRTFFLSAQYPLTLLFESFQSLYNYCPLILD